MLGIFSWLGGKTSIYIIAAVLLLAVIAGIYWEITHLEKRLQQLSAQNAQLEIANSSLQQSLKDLAQVQAQVVREQTSARRADATALQRSQQITNWNNNPHKREQLQRLRQQQPQRVIDLINKNAECERLHFAEQGQCINGQWRPAAAP